MRSEMMGLLRKESSLVQKFRHYFESRAGKPLGEVLLQGEDVLRGVMGIEPSPEENSIRRDVFKKLLAATRRLSKEEQVVVDTHYFQDKELKEVLGKVKRKLPAVSKMHKRALQKLRFELLNQGIRKGII